MLGLGVQLIIASQTCAKASCHLEACKVSEYYGQALFSVNDVSRVRDTGIFFESTFRWVGRYAVGAQKAREELFRLNSALSVHKWSFHTPV